MNKLELINILKQEANLSKAEAAKVVEVFFDEMANALANDERVEIRGLWPLLILCQRIQELYRQEPQDR